MTTATTSRLRTPLASHPRLRVTLGALVLVAIAIAFVGTSVLRQLPFSPFDEYVYLDYLDRSVTEGVVRSGDEVGDVARAEIECRGVQGFGLYGDGCGGSVDDDELFPYGGGTGADIYTPVHFWLTNVVAQPLTWVGVSLLDAGRLAGAAWASVMLLGIAGALRALRAHWSLQLGVPLLVLATPVATWSFAYISTDASVLAFSAVLAWLVILRMRGAASAWWLLPVSIVAVLCKVQSLGAVAAALLALLIHAIVVERRRGRALLPPIAAILVTGVAALAGQLVWLVVRSRLAVGEVADLGVGRDDLRMGDLVLQAGVPFAQAGSSSSAISISDSVVLVALSILVPAAVAAGVLGIGRGEPSPVRRSFAGGTLVAGLVILPALTLMTWFMLDVYIEPPIRYGAVVLPFAAVLVGLLLDDALPRRWTIVAAAAAAVLALLVWR